MDYPCTRRTRGRRERSKWTMNVTILSFADGATLWAGEPGEHLLHERHSTVSAVRARAQDCTQEVAQKIHWRFNRFHAFAHSGIFLHRQVLGSPAIHRTKRTIRLHHSSPSWLVRDHGQDLLEPPAYHLTAVRPHGLSTVCWEGRPGTVPAAGEDPEVDVVLTIETKHLKVYQPFFFCSQDANECWLQMMRVLQQKLDPLESATPMEVELVFTRILVYVVSSGCEMLLHIKRNQLCAVMLTWFFFSFYRQTLKAALLLPVRRRT